MRSITNYVQVFRWVAIIFGLLLVLFVLSQFLPEFIRKGGAINVSHKGNYLMMFFFGLAQLVKLV